jgi:hypothetical protein
MLNGHQPRGANIPVTNHSKITQQSPNLIYGHAHKIIVKTLPIQDITIRGHTYHVLHTLFIQKHTLLNGKSITRKRVYNNQMY